MQCRQCLAYDAKDVQLLLHNHQVLLLLVGIESRSETRLGCCKSRKTELVTAAHNLISLLEKVGIK